MNYLRSFLEEKKRTEGLQPATDKTDKTSSGSFVGGSIAFMSTKPAAPRDEKGPGDQPTKPFTWTAQAVETMLSTVLDRCAYWRERASAQIRPRIEKLIKEFEPIIAGLLEKGAYDSLRYCLIDLQRQIGDCLSGYGWNRSNG